jgi:hypothetical protein
VSVGKLLATLGDKYRYLTRNRIQRVSWTGIISSSGKLQGDIFNYGTSRFVIVRYMFTTDVVGPIGHLGPVLAFELDTLLG